MKRRLFLWHGLVATRLALVGGLLRPIRALANWPAEAFGATRLDKAVSLLTGNAPVSESDEVIIEAREIAEDGATVPIAIYSHLAGTRTIMVLSEKNRNPAVARFDLSSRVEPLIRMRIKMGGSGHVVAVVEADGGYYSSRKPIEVVAGGCG